MQIITCNYNNVTLKYIHFVVKLAHAKYRSVEVDGRNTNNNNNNKSLLARGTRKVPAALFERFISATCPHSVASDLNEIVSLEYITCDRSRVIAMAINRNKIHNPFNREIAWRHFFSLCVFALLTGIRLWFYLIRSTASLYDRIHTHIHICSYHRIAGVDRESFIIVIFTTCEA